MVILTVLKIVFFFHVYNFFFEKRPCTTLFHLNFSFALLQRVHSWVYKHWKWGGWWTHPGGGRFHPHLHVLQLVQDHLIRVTKCKINHVLTSLAASLIIKTTFLTDVIYIFVMFLKGIWIVWSTFCDISNNVIHKFYNMIYCFVCTFILTSGFMSKLIFVFIQSFELNQEVCYQNMRLLQEIFINV